MHDISNWLVIPGGPGMSNNYLKHVLPQAFSGYNLHFYDVYGSPESDKKDASIEEMVRQIEEQVSDFIANGGYGLITHSFGNYLALRLLEKKDSQLKALIMLNPIPFTYKDWKAALENIIKKIPAHILNQINDLSQQLNQGKAIFRLIYPYYVGNPAQELPVDVPFDADACNLIVPKVEDFSDLNLVSNSDLPMVRIVGELDPFYMDKNMMMDKTLVLKKVGHYPFFKDSIQFTNTVAKIGELLCQKITKKAATKLS